mmetsp:Transcript_38314/g.122861  ORF Transcript_38314/g.122861 Transcript_38314/m.122861 type:complete len:401 (+) Transcript_38314:197-1399(+)|eukprot:CAMPEP_0118902906 /NCGR_PEP_ID=MMETSP1166-20130328/7984_1 /TAXON_ID=1104430 /ORGANISM="Chrysoreinhardia sp, Strain CCMP3193" /LENGTH=400 /DNA_ID=CAMNT_0006842121 /DNA_START=166 /DNA_END=1368 /DNA_ORIENTATION=+
MSAELHSHHSAPPVELMIPSSCAAETKKSPTRRTTTGGGIMAPSLFKAASQQPRGRRGGVFATKEVASAAGSCAMYVACSTLMVLTNKWLASTLAVNAHVSLLMMQNAVATFLVSSCKTVGLVDYANFDRKVAARWFPVNIYFVAMLATSFVAMRYLSVPMITVFKQLANLLTVSGERYFFGKPVSKGVALSFATMIAGAALAALNDLEFSFEGYFWQGANCVCTSAYVLYLKYATKTVQLSKFAMVFYNNLLSLPLLLVIAVANGEPAALWDAHRNGKIDATFFAVNGLAGAVGFFLNLASVWCVSATSATTYAIVGALNKIPVTILGYLLFHTAISKDMALYISVSLVGGFLYSFEQLRQQWHAPGGVVLLPRESPRDTGGIPSPPPSSGGGQAPSSY